LDFVINDISIGLGGLMVNGKPTSHIRSLDELEDMGEILGTGSFGVVKKVKHKVTGNIYAMKVRFPRYRRPLAGVALSLSQGTANPTSCLFGLSFGFSPVAADILVVIFRRPI
jgi:hypothetical protein